MTLEELEERAKRRGDKPALRLIAAIRKRDAKHRNRLHEGPGVPSVGEDIYIGSSFYIDHGEDDVVGGLAEVAKVTLQVSGGVKMPFVAVKENPGTNYNWKYLQEVQAELKKEFGNKRAYQDPDLS